MFIDEFSPPWIHPKPPGLKKTVKELSNGKIAYIHNWICVEYDDELKWLMKLLYNAFPRTCKDEETIAALGVPGEFRLGPCQQMTFHPRTPGVASVFSAYRPCIGPTPWMVGMFNVREEPRIPMPHHLQNLPPKFRPGAKVRLFRSPPGVGDSHSLFRWFEEEAQLPNLKALSRNPYHGEIMIDAEALLRYSGAESQGTPHAVLMKDEDALYKNDLLDFSSINAYLSLSYTGLTPFLISAVRRGYQDDTRSLKLKKCVKELTFVGNYLDPQAPFPSDYWIYHTEQPL